MNCGKNRGAQSPKSVIRRHTQDLRRPWSFAPPQEHLSRLRAEPAGQLLAPMAITVPGFQAQEGKTNRGMREIVIAIAIFIDIFHQFY